MRINLILALVAAWSLPRNVVVNELASLKQKFESLHMAINDEYHSANREYHRRLYSERQVFWSERHQFRADTVRTWRMKELNLAYRYKIAEGLYAQLKGGLENPARFTEALEIRRESDAAAEETRRLGLISIAQEHEMLRRPPESTLNVLEHYELPLYDPIDPDPSFHPANPPPVPFGHPGIFR